MKRFSTLLMAVVLGAVALAGCSSSTDPNDGGPLQVIYTPDRQFLDVTIPGTFDFEVAPSRPANFQATWLLNGATVGTGTVYQYQSGAVGSDTLLVQTVLDGTDRQREWLITVLPSLSLLPPPVPDVLIQHGTAPMDVLVSWVWINQSAFPIIDYLIAASYDGPVTAANWDQANFLGAFPHVPGQAGYSELFTAEEHGMLPATTIWFGLRGRDDRGQLSPIPEIYRHTISFAWWIEGTVYDTEQNPLPEIIIDYGCGSCRVNSDVDGFYRIGPFRDVDAVDIFTLSRNVDLPGEPFTSWYDFQADPIVYNESGNTHDITLITRYGGTANSEFLDFLRLMTWTDDVTQLRPDQRLYKWPEYPVRVYIPDHVRQQDGLDFGENSRTGLGYWNLVMAQDYLVEVGDPGQAQIEFYFDDVPGANGITSLAAPQFPYFYRLGDVIPEKVIIGINNILPDDSQRVQELAMHELGHALGLYEHVEGIPPGETYLMALSSAGALDQGPENAVHADEKRMLNAIRFLPQGVDMAGFRLE